MKENNKRAEAVSVVIPAYNEKKAIFKLINMIKVVLDNSNYDYEIIVVDDGSTDDTADILKRIKGITVITHSYNKGYGKSLKDGIIAAKNEKIVMLDADGTYDPSNILRLLKYSNEYDIVSGVRVGKKVKIPLLRRPAKFILTSFAILLTNKWIPDLNCGMRVIKKSNVIKYFNILPQKFSFTITHLLACLSSDDNVKFVPINYYIRKGKSTIHPIKDFIKFINIIIRIITYFKPFKMFTMISLSILSLAFIVWIYTIIYLNKIADITVIVLILSSLQIFLFGLLADMIVKSNSRDSQ